jgi:hypothetical protein
LFQECVVFLQIPDIKYENRRNQCCCGDASLSDPDCQHAQPIGNLMIEIDEKPKRKDKPKNDEAPRDYYWQNLIIAIVLSPIILFIGSIVLLYLMCFITQGCNS